MYRQPSPPDELPRFSTREVRILVRNARRHIEAELVETRFKMIVSLAINLGFLLAIFIWGH